MCLTHHLNHINKNFEKKSLKNLHRKKIVPNFAPQLRETPLLNRLESTLKVTKCFSSSVG